MLKIDDNKIKISWWDVDDLVKGLCDKIIKDLPGGLIPAVLISHRLSLPYTDMVGRNTLVIDDICDSGITLKESPGAYHAVLHHKPHTSCFTPDLYAELHEGDDWLIYPWEMDDSISMQDYLNNKL